MKLLQVENGRVLVEGHRGAEALEPPNSWRAIETGFKLGADLLELDVHSTEDGVLVVAHDYTLPDGRWLHNLSWEEIAPIRLRGEPIPRLDEVLHWSRRMGACLSLDVKGGFLPEGLLQARVTEAVRAGGMLEQVMLLDFDHRALRAAKEGCPGLLTRALLRARPVNLRDMLTACACDAVSLSYDLIRPEDVHLAHEAGVAVALADMWRPDFERARELGVDIVSWGNPAHAVRELTPRPAPAPG